MFDTFSVRIRKKKIQKMNTLDDAFYRLGLAAPAVGLACFTLWRFAGQPAVFLPPCLFHFITGFYCPGCGGTRAVRALFAGHVFRAFCYHPFVPYAAGMYALFMLTQTVDRLSRHRVAIGMHYRNAYAWAAAAVILIQCLVKNVLLFTR